MYRRHQRPEHLPFQELYTRFAELCEKTMRERGRIFVNRFSVPHILPHGCKLCGALDYVLDEHGLHHVAPCAFPKGHGGAPELTVSIDVPSGELVFVERLEDLLPEAEIAPRYELASPFYWARLTQYAEQAGILVHAHHRTDAKLFRPAERPERFLIGNGKDTFTEYDGDFGATEELPWVVAVDGAHYDALLQRRGSKKPRRRGILQKKLVPGRYICTLRYPMWTRKIVTLTDGSNVLTSVFMRHEGPIQTAASLDEALKGAQNFAQANTWITPAELDRRFAPLLHAS